MAMLAEPRQRKRYNLTPRGKALYEDDSRFGTKMLEKMGWSKGKGLGPNESGNKDFVRVRMRNTLEGLGFEDRDDHWTQHEQDFSGLLKSLNGDNDVSEKAGGDKESASDEEAPRVGFGFTPEPKKPKVEKLKDKISGVSLEEKSKLSKARVHYRKFTKGKDIAQYSEKDLANIFGKKVVEAVQTDGSSTELTAITTKGKTYEKEESDWAEEKEVKPNFGGVQTISTGLSVSEYFKRKMEAMKSKQIKTDTENNEQKDVESLEELPERNSVEIKTKEKKRKRDEKALESEIKSTEAEYGNETDGAVKLELKKEKKVKNKLISGSTDLESNAPVGDAIVQASDIEYKKDKKKKRKQIESVDLPVAEQKVDSELPKKKRSKKFEEEQQINNEDEVIVDKEAPKKSKSKKSKDAQPQVNSDAIAIESAGEILTTETLEKKKKHKNAKDVETPLLLEKPIDEIVLKKSKKSKNTQKLSADTKTDANLPERTDSPENVSQQTTESSITISRKKSKKQKKGEKNDQVNVADGGLKNHGAPDGQKPYLEDVSAEISLQTLTLDELIAKCNSLNVYTISSFCAEKFRNVALDEFKGSTIAQLPGYSYTDKDLQLNIINLPSDEKRIVQLWNCSINKYQEANPRAIFGKYKKNVVSVLYKGKNKNGQKQERKRIPRFYTKSLKRKSVFQSI
ncbi:ankyrin repeat domain-containing protein 11 isoform X1 [Anastrepha obliqua]|uniref:ankyrin repeat domain-containing protein 11 isoform X1 n=1 Tax=Anastrepha obliqua TaxID=95512 RepID=UPI002409E1EC|nr:ankyrin repeat domain-containing protein 11 isoform X1 [Anastrepha obliqua]